jgi:hypothetical protein
LKQFSEPFLEIKQKKRFSLFFGVWCRDRCKRGNICGSYSIFPIFTTGSGGVSFSSNVLWLRCLRLSFPEGSGRGRTLGLSDGRTGRLSPAFARRRIGRGASLAGRRGGVSGLFPSNRALRWAGIVSVEYPETIAGGPGGIEKKGSGKMEWANAVLRPHSGSLGFFR